MPRMANDVLNVFQPSRAARDPEKETHDSMRYGCWVTTALPAVTQSALAYPGRYRGAT
jgi:hypothetical protein